MNRPAGGTYAATTIPAPPTHDTWSHRRGRSYAPLSGGLRTLGMLRQNTLRPRQRAKQQRQKTTMMMEALLVDRLPSKETRDALPLRRRHTLLLQRRQWRLRFFIISHLPSMSVSCTRHPLRGVGNTH